MADDDVWVRRRLASASDILLALCGGGDDAAGGGGEDGEELFDLAARLEDEEEEAGGQDEGDEGVLNLLRRHFGEHNCWNYRYVVRKEESRSNKKFTLWAGCLN